MKNSPINLIIIIALLLLSCVRNVVKDDIPTQFFLDSQTERYRKDKIIMEKTYLDNIESERLSMLLEDGLAVNKDSINPEIASGYMIYTPYAVIPTEDGPSITSPVKTENRISLTVDTIVYNADSLMCVALVIVKVRNNLNEGIENLSDTCSFDGFGVIGMRKDKNGPFYLFPMSAWLLGNNGYSSTRDYIRNTYFKRLKDVYSYGIGDPQFFTDTPYFQMDSTGRYDFETYTYLNQQYPYYKYTDKQ